MLLRVSILLALPAVLWAQNFDTVQVRVQHLRGGVYMLTGAGGNIGLSVGTDAAFLVDDQFAPLTARIIAAVKTVTDQPIRFVVNTHWHFDHTGGNENLGKAGALLVAHQNVRRRMSTEQFIEFLQRRYEPSPMAALPVITFTDSIAFHINGEDLVAYHVPAAHTDGDAIVHFTGADVVHMGDIFVRYGYPFIDLASGGNANGIITAADRVLQRCTNDTRIIPGHGAVADCTVLRTYRDMVATIRDRVVAAMREGRSLDAIRAAKLTADFDATWRGAFINGDQFVEFVYRSLGGR